MSHGLKNMSPKTKMALGVSALFVAFGAVMAYGTLSYFERKFDETILNQQYSLVSSLALGIDNKLTMAQNAFENRKALGHGSNLIGRICTDFPKARLYTGILCDHLRKSPLSAFSRL